MKLKSHWTLRNWLAFPLLLVPLAWFFVYADDPKQTETNANLKPAETTPAVKQETVSEETPSPDTKETKEELAQPTKSDLENPSIGGGLGGLGGGGGGFSGLGAGPASPPQNHLMTANGAVTWNKEKTVYWGYSNSLGKWASVRPHKDSGPAFPIASRKVFALQLKDRVYGYSTSVGRWDELKVKDPHPDIQGDCILVEDGDKIHMFSDNTGRWASSGEEAEPTPVAEVNDDFLMRAPPVTLGGRTGASPGGASPSRTRPQETPFARPSGSGLTLNIPAISTSAPNLWRRRADLYQQSARDLLVAMQRIDIDTPDAGETQERMKKEYDELLNLTVDAQLKAQKEDAQLLKSRLEKIEAQIAENEKAKEETVKKLDEQLSVSVNTPLRRPARDDDDELPKTDDVPFKDSDFVR